MFLMKLTRLTATAFVFLAIFTAHDAAALTISPVRVEITGNPGQTLRGEMEILNEQGETKTFFSSFENFEPSGDTGSPRFVSNTGNLSTWMKTTQRIDIATNEKQIIPFTIAIPADAEPGGYFSAIFWGSQDPKTQEAGEVAIGGKLGVLILLRVAGDIHEEAGLSEFVADNGKRLLTAVPVTIGYRFTNKGDDRVVPLGDIVIKNTFGMEVESLKANESEGNVLPNSSRKFQVIWSKDAPKDIQGFLANAKAQLANFHFGFYRAQAAIVWGSTNKVETASTWFFLFPWQSLSIVAAGLIIVYFLLRRYNAWIISRSGARK
jgi:hypothetical protein